MTCQTPVTASAGWSGYCRPVGRTPRRPLVAAAGFGLIVPVLLAGGCGSRNLVVLNSPMEFRQQVVQSKKPVMVHFFKSGCPACLLLEPAMDRLATDYSGRAVFAKYYLMNFFGTVTDTELRAKYDIRVYPTVVLFVDGQEKQRWVTHYHVKSYRKALDGALGVPTTQATAAPVVPEPQARGEFVRRLRPAATPD